MLNCFDNEFAEEQEKFRFVGLTHELKFGGIFYLLYLTALCRSVIIRHESHERSLPMGKYIPYEKLSKRSSEERDAKGAPLGAH